MTRVGYLAIIAIVLASLAFPAIVPAQGSTFSYQGRLKDAGVIANGSFLMLFRLFDAVSGGAQIGPVLNDVPVTVTEGIFSVNLDFGAGAYPGQPRWLEILVRHNGGEPYTTLGPREQLASSPYSVRALSSANADAAANATNLGGVAAAQYLQINGNGSGLTNLNGGNIINNTVTASALASDTFPNARNLSLLGSLRWDLLGLRVNVGANPLGAAFDGTNIWIVNNLADNLTKIKVSDGTIVGTYPVGDGPVGIAFDGANIWTANQNAGSVTKLRASDGACVGTCNFIIGAGTQPIGITSDGTNVWTTNNGAASVSKVRISDGALQGTFPSGGTFPYAIAFDGANLWVTNSGSANVARLRTTDGSCPAAPCTVSVGTNPRGLAFDGANIWVSNLGGSSVTKLRSVDGACVATCTIAVSPNPIGLAFDGANIWVTSGSGGNVTKLRASDGSVQGIYGIGGTASFGIAFDGASMWVTNSADSKVSKAPAF